ncbi:MAG: acyl-CoA dehydrogenase family protein [Woeseiaceae bacterium]|nr:acyl-CoA dehydrogenase family protein [Woeseiaceae bacterium]
MNYELSDEQLQFRDSVVKFAQGELSDHVSTSDSEEFPYEKWRSIAEFGLLGLCVPESYGGAGLDCVSAANVIDALGYGCLDHGLVHAVCTQNLCAIHVNEYGSAEQKSSYLEKLCRGDLIAAQAISEPDAGSEAGAIRTMAIESDDGYVLNGSKIYISNGPVADLVIVYAVTAPEKKVLGRTSCFLVERGSPGFDQAKPDEKMGLHTLKNGGLFFADCAVPETSLVGRKGAGSAMFSSSMNWERVLLFASFAGKLQRILERSAGFARERKQFGVPISSFQAISHRIAEMRINLELTRLVIAKAAWQIDNGKPSALYSSIGKLLASEACKSACMDAVQIHGGMGYMAEGDLERELRDSIAGTIYSGSSEIQRNIIAKLSGV